MASRDVHLSAYRIEAVLAAVRSYWLTCPQRRLGEVLEGFARPLGLASRDLDDADLVFMLLSPMASHPRVAARLLLRSQRCKQVGHIAVRGRNGTLFCRHCCGPLDPSTVQNPPARPGQEAAR